MCCTVLGGDTAPASGRHSGDEEVNVIQKILDTNEGYKENKMETGDRVTCWGRWSGGKGRGGWCGREGLPKETRSKLGPQ